MIVDSRPSADENKPLWWSKGKKTLHQNGPRNNQNIRPENYMFCVSKIYKPFFQCEKKPNEQYSFEAETPFFSA